MRYLNCFIIVSLLAFIPLNAEEKEEETFAPGQEMLGTYLKNKKEGGEERKAELIHDALVEEALKDPEQEDEKSPKAFIVAPFLQHFSIFEGAFTHFAHYNHCVIATKLSGFQYGFQYFMTHSGVVFIVNPLYLIEDTPCGTYLRHEYLDSTVLTGQDQVILFY